MYWILFGLGIYMIIFSLVMNTKNFASALIFKIIPILGGLYSILLSLFLNGIIIMK